MTLMRRDLLLSGALAAAGVATAGPTLAQETTPNPPGPPTPYPPREDKAIPITNLYDLEDDAKKALPLDVFITSLPDRAAT
jgi:hypothetical protein